ncbi:hypothetical protein CTI12_AA450190 [Artemisia annua]|uniref:Uncharacterized protein n=1 Tax=Artemisia annua TaxID=35608 RepID=A0A2U1LUX3_ARTAN|nr:hypothetical protein CTI12_AA450190 [Artemisia annua]
MVFGHDDKTCLKRVVAEGKKQSVNTNDGKNEASMSGTKKILEIASDKIVISNPMEALNLVTNDDAKGAKPKKTDVEVTITPNVETRVERLVSSSSNVKKDGKSIAKTVEAIARVT